MIISTYNIIIIVSNHYCVIIKTLILPTRISTADLETPMMHACMHAFLPLLILRYFLFVPTN
jgi:hypothetical protein